MQIPCARRTRNQDRRHELVQRVSPSSELRAISSLRSSTISRYPNPGLPGSRTLIYTYGLP